MALVTNHSKLVTASLGRYFQPEPRQVQSSPGAVPRGETVSFSPGLARMETHAAVMSKTFAQFGQSFATLGSGGQAADVPSPSLEIGIAAHEETATGFMAEDVLGKIVGPAFDEFQAENPDATTEDLERFREQALAALDRGFAESQEFLASVGTLDQAAQDRLDNAKAQTLERFESFMDNVSQFSDPPGS